MIKNLEPIKNISEWAKENNLRPFLLVDLKSGTISAIITDYGRAYEYATKKHMAVYTEDMFKVGFWVGDDPATNLAFYNFATENGILRYYTEQAEELNKALAPYGANYIVIKNWGVSYDDSVRQFVAFQDQMGLTMFLLRFSNVNEG